MAEPIHRETLRPAIVAKAGAILESDGLEALQARRVAAEAGCSVGTLYNLFGDIDGLMIAVNATTLAMLGEAVGVESENIANLSLVDRLNKLALAYAQFARDHYRRWDAVFRHRMLPGKAVPDSYVEDQDRLLAIIEEAIGDHAPDPARRGQIARALFGAVHGIVVLALDNRLGGRAQSELEDQVKLILQLAVFGLDAAGGSSSKV